MVKVSKPKVFCYFFDLGDKFAQDSKELIPLWTKSWSNNGFDPIVLSRSDATSHPLYDEKLWSSDSNLTYNSKPKKPEYIKACYERWFAYSVAVQKENFIHWADYDVINYGYDASSIISKPCRFDNAYCCGVLNRAKSNEIIDAIIKYAGVDKEEFNSLNLGNNNDMCLLGKLKILHINRMCSDPTSVIKNAPHWKEYLLNHFHGGIKRYLSLKCETRLKLIEELRPYA